MKILIISDVSIHKIAGGAERVLFEQSQGLHHRNHLVVILTRRLQEHAADMESVQGIPEYRYALKRGNSVTFMLTTFWNSKKLVEKLHAKYDFDMVIIHQPFSAIGLMFSRLFSDLKKIYVCHSLSFQEYISRNTDTIGLAGWVISRINILARKWIEKQILERADLIVVLSRFTQDKLEQVHGIPREKISIIVGGTDIERFTPSVDKQHIRKILNLPIDKIILLTVRNLVPRMGLEGLLEAFEKVLKKEADVHLVIGGEGYLKEEINEMACKLGIDKQVTLAGFIPEERLSEYYSMADLFVLPTKELEGFGLVTVEALASGVPVVGTPVGGTREILGSFDNGLLFKDNTPAAMAELILEKVQIISGDPEKWHKISMACRKYAENNYSWDKNLDALEKLMLMHTTA